MTDERKLYPGINLGVDHGKAHWNAEKRIFGFWVFVMSDIIIFGLCFATYAILLTPKGLAKGPGPKDLFDLQSIFVQTLILLASSFSYGQVSCGLKSNKERKWILLWLGITASLALGFLSFELHDFSKMISSGAVPSRSAWLSSFYLLIGLHGLHISFGVIWIFFMIAQILLKKITETTKIKLLILGVFWHFIGLIWVAIFSFVFLAGFL